MINNSIGKEYVSTYLNHYGVKGMHWGHRKPEEKLLGRMSRREKKAHKFDVLAKNAKTERQQKIYEREAERARTGKLSRRQRQALVAGAIIAAYATYKVVDSGEAHRLITNGRNFISGKDISSKWVRNEAYGRKDLTADEAFNNIARHINEGYGQPGTTNNCRRCTFAYIKAREGYDVEATRTHGGSGQNNINLYNAVTDKKQVKGGLIGAITEVAKGNKDYKQFLMEGRQDLNLKSNIKLTNNKKWSSENIFAELSKHPVNSRGELDIKWTAGGGHSMAWEVFKDKVAIIDTQTGTMWDSPEKFQYTVGRFASLNYSRLDNIKLNDNIIGRWITNAKH